MRARQKQPPQDELKELMDKLGLLVLIFICYTIRPIIVIHEINNQNRKDADEIIQVPQGKSEFVILFLGQRRAEASFPLHLFKKKTAKCAIKTSACSYNMTRRSGV